MWICESVCSYAHIGEVGMFRGQKRAPDAQELESEVVVSILIWALAIKPGSSVGGARALIHRAFSPAPMHLFYRPTNLDCGRMS